MSTADRYRRSTVDARCRASSTRLVASRYAAYESSRMATPPAPTVATMKVVIGGGMVSGHRPAPVREPVGRENRPHHVVPHERAVAESVAKHPVAPRPEPFEQAVGAVVDVDHTRLEAVHAELGEDRMDEQFRACGEEALAPEC